MQTEKLPYSIASNNVDKKVAIIIDGNIVCVCEIGSRCLCSLMYAGVCAGVYLNV